MQVKIQRFDSNLMGSLLTICKQVCNFGIKGTTMAANKKPVVQEPVKPHEHKKETSGDKKFDEAIDKFFKKLVTPAPSK